MKIWILICGILVSSALYAQPATQACSSEQHRQFDFWIGEWQVKTADGNAAGSSSITVIEDKCVLLENWSAVAKAAGSAYTGTSFNYYNQRSKQWEQLWLDNQGGFLKLSGQRIGEQMILESAPAVNADNKEVTQRITWTRNDDGTVRQHWEILTKGEETNSAFDGIYRPAE